MSAAHDFGKERGVSGAHKNHERVNALYVRNRYSALPNKRVLTAIDS